MNRFFQHLLISLIVIMSTFCIAHADTPSTRADDIVLRCTVTVYLNESAETYSVKSVMTLKDMGTISVSSIVAHTSTGDVSLSTTNCQTYTGTGYSTYGSYSLSAISSGSFCVTITYNIDGYVYTCTSNLVSH